MLNIYKEYSLKNYNTFGLDVTAYNFVECNNISDLKDALIYLNDNPQKHFILGGGSNILFSENFNGLIIHPSFSEIKKIKEDEDNVWLKADAGVNWDDFVHYCVQNGWYGVENMSYIPGTAGASPVQNIGAYGSEAKDCIESVHGLMIANGEPFTLNNKECRFGYRQSIFKSELKNKTVITSVIFKLSKRKKFNLGYGDLEKSVANKGEISLATIRNTIIEIRKSKLPEPEDKGNAGSFFKNPVVDTTKFTAIKNRFPDMPFYSVDNSHYKIPAGWLIETAGWKGKNFGNAGVHNKQALILVNNGGASAQEIINLANGIISDISSKFGIVLEPEVNIL